MFWHSPSLDVLAAVSVLRHNPSLGVLAGVSVLTQSEPLVFLLVSVCYDTIRAFGVLAGVSVLRHNPSLGVLAGVSVLRHNPSLWCSCWCQSVTTQSEPLVFLLVSVCCDTIQALVFLLVSVCYDTIRAFGVLAGVSVLRHNPSLWCSCWCRCADTPQAKMVSS